MIFFWLVPFAALVVLAIIWFTRRVAGTSSVASDSDIISTDDARRERRNEIRADSDHTTRR